MRARHAPTAGVSEFSDGTAADITTSVSWSSGEPAVATISNAPGSEGLASAVATGTTGISAAHGGTTGTGMLRVTSATLTSITVVPASSSRPGGAFQTFAADGTYSDGSMFDLTAQVSWSSSATSVATISNAPGLSGVAFTNGPGSTTISATLGGLTASAMLTVTSATLTSIAVSPLAPVRNVDDTWTFRAIGHYSDGWTLDLTDYAAWSSDDPAILVVSDAVGNKGDAAAWVLRVDGRHLIVPNTTVDGATRDGSKWRRRFSVSPSTDYETGVRATLDWLRANPNVKMHY